MQPRSAAYIGCSGSIASGTFAARACGRTAAMPSANMPRAALMSREPFGKPPPIRIRQSAPIAAASSIIVLLSSIAACRPAASAAGNSPPRQ